MIRVLVVSHIPLLCDLIKTVLDQEPDIQVVNCVSDTQAAMQASDPCDVVIVNANLPGDESFHLVQALGAQRLGPRAVVFGMPRSDSVALRYLDAGAAGCVHSDDSVNELTQVVRAAASDGVLLSPYMAGRVIQRVTQLAAKCRAPRPISDFPFDNKGLTARERQVLELMAQGYSNQDIARLLMIELGTTKNHVHNILGKLQAKNRKEAVTYASLGVAW